MFYPPDRKFLCRNRELSGCWAAPSAKMVKNPTRERGNYYNGKKTQRSPIYLRRGSRSAGYASQERPLQRDPAGHVRARVRSTRAAARGSRSTSRRNSDRADFRAGPSRKARVLLLGSPWMSGRLARRGLGPRRARSPQPPPRQRLVAHAVTRTCAKQPARGPEF